MVHVMTHHETGVDHEQGRGDEKHVPAVNLKGQDDGAGGCEHENMRVECSPGQDFPTGEHAGKATMIQRCENDAQIARASNARP